MAGLELRPARRSAGHAMEFRINAEDPQHGFRRAPAPSRSSKPRPRRARGSYVRTGSRISPYYDSLVAKLVACGQIARKRSRAARSTSS
ncbi:MAG: hypothetical protein ACLSVD_14225 [Eggerthellaceae bacterium]